MAQFGSEHLHEEGNYACFPAQISLFWVRPPYIHLLHRPSLERPYFKFHKPHLYTTLYFSHKDYLTPNGEAIRVHYCPTFEIANQALEYAVGKTKFALDCEWGVDPYTVADRSKYFLYSILRIPLAKPPSRVVVRRNSRVPYGPPQGSPLGHPAIYRRRHLYNHLSRFATEDFHLAQLVPDALHRILESKDILKVGAEVKGDADPIEQ